MVRGFIEDGIVDKMLTKITKKNSIVVILLIIREDQLLLVILHLVVLLTNARKNLKQPNLNYLLTFFY